METEDLKAELEGAEAALAKWIAGYQQTHAALTQAEQALTAAACALPEHAPARNEVVAGLKVVREVLGVKAEWLK